MGDNWQKVREIFDAALRCKPEERQKFVKEACGNERTLIEEVNSLLASLESASNFLETPAVANIADAPKIETKKLEKGNCLGHYEIVKQIGEGGMGEVYLAKDTRLNRYVALKLLSATVTEDRNRVSRFRQEAFATSALNHPNILTIYEIGEWQGREFIATEFIEGVTLRSFLRKKKLSVGEALDIALQIASALAAAHGAGIVHRDIKPENVMIRPDGLVKVLDFGIAKYRPSEKGQKVLVQTEAGEVIGTAAYMSPEQARGLEIDRQTDVWSLGVIIYEVFAGRLPFPGETRSDRIVAILEREPEPIGKLRRNLPPQLQQIIGRALAKDKKKRYSEIADLAKDLQLLRETTGDKMSSPLILRPRKTADKRRVYALAALSLIVIAIGAFWSWSYLSKTGKTISDSDDRKSIAVLPLKLIGAGNRDEIYEIGIADSLINKLGGMKNFVVRPLSAMRKYSDINQDPIAAGREQQADFVLASNYQLAGGKIRVTSELLNVANGEIVETYKSGEKNAGDVFATQDQIAVEVGNFLLTRFAAMESTAQTAKRGTENEEAYRLYLQGMYFYDRRTRPDAYKAIEVLEQAVRLDPNYARAWAGLAHAHRYRMNLDINSDAREGARKLTEAANKALALDNNISEAYSALCENKLSYEYDFAAAEAACKRAIELKPDSAVAHNIYARFLMTRGRFEESVAEIKTAIDLEPTSYFHQIVYAVCLIEARRYDEAFRQMDRLAELNPPNAFNLYSGNNSALMTQESPSKAFERTMKYLKFANTDEPTLQLYQKIYQTEGWQGVMREQARRFGANPTVYMFFAATIYAQIGDKDKAMEFLEKSYQRREFWMAYLKVEPSLDNLRGDSRFEELIRRVESK